MQVENEVSPDSPPASQPDLGSLLVILLKGVLYQDSDGKRWSQLLVLQNRIKDYVSILSLELVLDEAEGYAFLRSRQDDDEDGEGEDIRAAIPRLISRRQLSFPVSLLLALLRKKLVEFDASGVETRLVLTRDDIVELIRLFLPDSSNEAKLLDQVDRHINKVVELGFLRALKTTTSSSQSSYEVRRIIKSYVDAQWLAELDKKLEVYRQQLVDKDDDSE